MNTEAAIVKVTTKKGRWMGVKGTSVTAHLTKSTNGLRVELLTLEGNEKAELKLVKGNAFRNPEGFRCFAVAQVNPDLYDDEIYQMLQLAASLTR